HHAGVGRARGARGLRAAAGADCPVSGEAANFAAQPVRGEGLMTPDLAEILLVDDRPENLLALEAILEPLGQTLVRALSGEDALREVLRHDFAVILLDVQ